MKFFKRSLLVLCLLFAAAFAASCGGNTDPDNQGGGEPAPESEELRMYKAYIVDDLQYVLKGIEGQVSDSVFARCQKQELAGEQAIQKAKSVKGAMRAYKTAKQAIANCIPLANGIFSYSGLSQDEKTDILGVLEAYAVRNGITGITLFENGSYAMYNERVTLGTEVYIVGYGFGLLAEGSINADLEYETNEAWKRYLHTWNVADPGTANYLNDQGSEVGDFYGYFGASFFTTFMNETKDGYDWVVELAKEKPQPVEGLDANGQAKKYRFEVRIGDELQYNTNSQIPSRAAFNGRNVELEDYITPFKLLLTQSNHLYRGSELANTSSGAIKGAKKYYNDTAEGAENGNFDEVGVKAYMEGEKAYFEVEFTTAYTPYYAMYYIASSLYMPVPQDFIDLVTLENYLGYNADKTETPVDNSLSLGAYTLEQWDADQQVVYKKNPYYVYADSKYAIQGIHINILPGAAEDVNLGIKEFLAGHTDSTGIPQDYLDQYKSDPRTRQTKGDSNFKLNVNATSAKVWEQLFGTHGSVVQTPEEDYWDVEPALSNSHFVRALSYSIDRLSYSSARGSVPSVSYLASNYMSDGENGISYSGTAQHAKAIERLVEDTDGYGYNLSLARDLFKVALMELEAQGAYKGATAEKPITITLEIAWQRPNNEEYYHKEIAQFLEEAFNHESVSGGRYKLEVNFWVGNNWSDVYYGKMMVGQFDLGFGSISGNSLDPLGFISVLSSDQSISGNFTLNWGTDTNDPNADILVYNGLRWSYDALYLAGNGTCLAVKGASQPAFAYETSWRALEGGAVEITIDILESEDCSIDDIDIVFYGYTKDAGDYFEYELVEGQKFDEASGFSVEAIEGGKRVTVVIGPTEYEWLDLEDSFGLDLYGTLVEFGNEKGFNYVKSFDEFELN